MESNKGFFRGSPGSWPKGLGIWPSTYPIKISGSLGADLVRWCGGGGDLQKSVTCGDGIHLETIGRSELNMKLEGWMVLVEWNKNIGVFRDFC